MALPIPLSSEEEKEAIQQLIKGEEKARNLLIEHNLRLVVYIAKRFNNTGIDIEELISVGTVGLIKAVKSYNSEKKIKLATYASRCIENEILMYLRRVVRSKGEISLDEPLNVDWEGNKLLLSDILGTDADSVYKEMEAGSGKGNIERSFIISLTTEKKMMSGGCVTDCTAKKKKRKGNSRYDEYIPIIHKPFGKKDFGKTKKDFQKCE